MILPIVLLFVSLGILVVIAVVRVLQLERRVAGLNEAAGVLAAKIAILSHFLRASKTLQSDIDAFNKVSPHGQGRLPEGFALERWRGLRDKDRFGNWRVAAGKASKNEARDEEFSVALDAEREYGIRLNARPFLAVLHHKLPFVVSQEHVAWLEKTDSVFGFLEWLIGDIEKGSKGQLPPEIDSLKSLIQGNR